MRWRRVGDGDGFARWVRLLRHCSGVYLIRDAGAAIPLLAADGGQMLYIGESHTANLYETLTRHFQRWPRDHFHGYDRATYDRETVDVAVIVTTPAKAVSVQDHLIARHHPRDNRQEPIPF